MYKQQPVTICDGFFSLYYAVNFFTYSALVLVFPFLPEFRLSFPLSALQGVLHIPLSFLHKRFLKSVFRWGVGESICPHKGAC